MVACVYKRRAIRRVRICYGACRVRDIPVASVSGVVVVCDHESELQIGELAGIVVAGSVDQNFGTGPVEVVVHHPLPVAVTVIFLDAVATEERLCCAGKRTGRRAPVAGAILFRVCNTVNQRVERTRIGVASLIIDHAAARTAIVIHVCSCTCEVRALDPDYARGSCF